jgi:predicted nucleotidyltransferase
MKQEIKNIIINRLRTYDPQMFGVFGSYAKNENTGESDHILEAIIKFKISPQEFPGLSLTEMS